MNQSDTDRPLAVGVHIDNAVEQIRQRLGIPEGPAVEYLLDAIRSGELGTWKKEHDIHSEFRVKQSYAAWKSAFVDLDEFRERNQGGICFRGRNYHLHSFLIDDTGFQHWLDGLHRPSPADAKKSPENAPDDVTALLHTKRNSNGHDCREDDAPLVGEMGELIAPRAQQSGEAITDPPTNAMMTAWEVVTWIAFGRALTENRLDREVAAEMTNLKKIEDAKAQLRDRAAGERLVVFGKPAGRDVTGRINSLYQQLPPELFLNIAITLTDWNPVYRDFFRPMKERWSTKLPRFEDMMFKTAQVLELWQEPVAIGFDAAGKPQAADLVTVATPSTAAPVITKRRLNGLDYRSDDEPLVAEMRTLIENKRARSPVDAARAVVTGAVGHGSESSKVARLAKHYREHFVPPS